MASMTVALSHVYRKATEELGMQQCKRELTWKLLLFLDNFYGFG